VSILLISIKDVSGDAIGRTTMFQLAGFNYRRLHIVGASLSAFARVLEYPHVANSPFSG